MTESLLLLLVLLVQVTLPLACAERLFDTELALASPTTAGVGASSKFAKRQSIHPRPMLVPTRGLTIPATIADVVQFVEGMQPAPGHELESELTTAEAAKRETYMALKEAKQAAELVSWRLEVLMRIRCQPQLRPTHAPLFWRPASLPCISISLSLSLTPSPPHTHTRTPTDHPNRL